MLSERERTLLMLDANRNQLAKIDAILLNKDTSPLRPSKSSFKTFSITQAAAELNLSRKSVYALIKEDLLKTIPFRNHTRISEQAIRDYLFKVS